MSVTPTAANAVDLAVLATYEEAQIEGEPDFVVELIDLYLNEAPRLLASLRTSFENNDRATAKRTAHSLRGSSGNLGALQIAVLAGELEHLDDPCGTAARELLSQLEIEFRAVSEILSAERRRRMS